MLNPLSNYQSYAWNRVFFGWFYFLHNAHYIFTQNSETAQFCTRICLLGLQKKLNIKTPSENKKNKKSFHRCF